MAKPSSTTHSIELYGKPDDTYRVQDFTALDAAIFFLEKTDEWLGSYAVPVRDLLDQRCYPTVFSVRFANHK